MDGADISGDRMSDVKSFFQSSYTKMGVGAILAFVGVVGGIYVGYGITTGRDKAQTASASIPELPQDPKIALNFKVGDAFPPESYVDLHDVTHDFAELLNNRETVLIFASTTCGPCLDLLRFAHERMIGRLKKGIQVVVVLDKERLPVPEEYQGLLDGTTVALVDGAYWQATYHWVFWPVIVGVDNSGIVQHVQYGYVNAIDHELVEYFYSTN